MVIARRRIFTVFLLLSLAQLCVAKDKRSCVKPEAAQDQKFHPGQVWQYKTRPGEADSFLTILKVESLPKFGIIIHVRVDKIRLKNCTGGPEPEQIAHMPFARDAIERSVTKLVKEKSDIPSFQDGYDEWSKACGGVYTITVAEVVQANQATFSSGLGCPAQ
jgi:hypothetical protein